MRTNILCFRISFKWQRSQYNKRLHKVTNGLSLLYTEFFLSIVGSVLLPTKGIGAKYQFDKISQN